MFKCVHYVSLLWVNCVLDSRLKYTSRSVLRFGGSREIESEMEGKQPPQPLS